MTKYREQAIKDVAKDRWYAVQNVTRALAEHSDGATAYVVRHREAYLRQLDRANTLAQISTDLLLQLSAHEGDSESVRCFATKLKDLK